MALSDKVTDAIADGVGRLLDLGVSKVMVNSLPPLGCTPFMSQMFSYSSCDPAANRASDMHNKALSKKLDQFDDVLVLDINSIFSDLARGNYMACCTGTDERKGGYCGREDATGTPQYTLCSNLQDFFYWDYMHPTQAGWNAVMDRLQGSIHDFLSN
jgi:phospholipase/lecithinase/hemolysin